MRRISEIQVDRCSFRAGDFVALRAAVDDPGNVPNGPRPLRIGSGVGRTGYPRPLLLIRKFLEFGAGPHPANNSSGLLVCCFVDI